tara:strand:- start:130 stop:717 length:588 start_codon:yes stop_codon:yes gene_type:complete
MKKLEIQFSDGELQRIVDYCNSDQQYSPVITKYNKKENWKAISIKGFSKDPLVISKPNVLGVGSGGNLQETPLVDRLQIRPILEKIPAMTERVRLMKLEAGTKISKHTDKVDKDIKSRKIIRLHVPIITNDNVKMISWLDKNTPMELKMKKGECWWLDVSKAHSVLNESDVDRVHLVIDVFVNNYMSEVMYGTGN